MATPLPILMYHKVSRPSQGSTNRGLYVSANALDWQLGHLRARGFAFVDFESLASARDGGAPLPPKPVLLTFDDGHRDNYEEGLPVLRRHGAKATVFVLAGEMGASGAVWEEASERAPTALLTWEQAREMRRHGVSIQSHGMFHRKLDRLPAAEVARQVRDSRQRIEQEIGVAPIAFAYPYGAYDEAVAQAVADAGYRFACTIEKGGNEFERLDPLALRRFAVKGYRWTHHWAFRRLAARSFR